MSSLHPSSAFPPSASASSVITPPALIGGLGSAAGGVGTGFGMGMGNGNISVSSAMNKVIQKFESDWRSAPAARRPKIAGYLAGAGPEAERVGLLTALIRSDMALHFETGDPVAAAGYMKQFPELDVEARVEIIYEEFCLREEVGEVLERDEFLGRYPQDREKLQPVLDIHQWVGSSQTASLLPGGSGNSTRMRSGSRSGLGFGAGFDTPSTMLHPIRADESAFSADAFHRTDAYADFDNIVGPGRKAVPELPTSPATLPQVKDTIDGFELEEELGRGSFARVFLARENRLSRRYVALKVSRTGSPEPQTLAKLQHTHIVPIYSYIISRPQNFHLICMPYYGKVTLAQLLAEPEARGAREGVELLHALDRLQAGRGHDGDAVRNAARRFVEQASFPRAIAFWMARLADGLQHAHDRGILHRDIKPSNILVTRDALPMLLDFNLAQTTLNLDADLDAADLDAAVSGECRRSDAEGKNAGAGNPLGGTLVYMSPEHLEALALGHGERVDGRADIYSFGVVMYEALAGQRPFGISRDAMNMSEALLRAAEQRRNHVPRVRRANPRVSAALDAVVAKCLMPDPAMRYQKPSELAADLQAVADDSALRYAREPQPARTLRWVRRNRAKLALALPIVLGLAVLNLYLSQLRMDQLRDAYRTAWFMLEGEKLYREKNFPEAEFLFNAAGGSGNASLDQRRKAENYLRKAEVKFSEPLQDMRREALDYSYKSREGKKLQAAIKDLHGRAPRIRFALLGFGKQAMRQQGHWDLLQVLEPFYVYSSENWTQRGELQERSELIEPAQREALIREVNELMFLAAVDLVKSDDPNNRKRVLANCTIGQAFSPRPAPWKALEAWVRNQPEPPLAPEVRAADEADASAAFLWGILRLKQQRHNEALVWFQRAAGKEENNGWYQHCLAELYDYFGQFVSAEKHYHFAVALNSDTPYVYYDRARMYQRREQWELALRDLEKVIELSNRTPGRFPEAILNRGLIYQLLGDLAQARTDFETVLSVADLNGEDRRYAQLNMAALDVQEQRYDDANVLYGALLESEPSDASALWGRAVLAKARLDDEAAIADATRLLAVMDAEDRSLKASALSVSRADVLEFRALAHLRRKDVPNAANDAREAVKLDRSPRRQRLWNRVLLEQDNISELVIPSPEDLDRWPQGGEALGRKLLASMPQLDAAARSADPQGLQARWNQVVIWCVLKRPALAWEIADGMVTGFPASPRAWLARAYAARALNRLDDAKADLDRGKAWDPNDHRFGELAAAVALEQNDPLRALDLLNRSRSQGGGGANWHQLQAQTLSRLHRDWDALNSWESALRNDPENPRIHLGRARTFINLQLWDRALVAVEKALAQSGGRADIRDEALALQNQCAAARTLPKTKTAPKSQSASLIAPTPTPTPSPTGPRPFPKTNK